MKSAILKTVAPEMSNFVIFLVVEDSLINITAIKIAISPRGILKKNTERHPKLSISGPPISGPRIAPDAILADQIPRACVRFLVSANVTVKIAIAVG